MIRYLYFKIFCINFIFPIKSYCQQKYMTHPIAIEIDSANLDYKNLSHKILLEYLINAVGILSKIVNIIQTKDITPKLLANKCKRKLKITKKKTSTSDIIIFPIFDNIKNNDIFQVAICEENPSDKFAPNIALFFIKNNLDINSYIKNPLNEYTFKLKIFKYLLDCLGLSIIFRCKSKQARDNFFETPTYLIENSFSYHSIKKLYKLKNLTLNRTEINDCGDFYLPYWPYDSIIKDFRNEEIDIRFDMTETSFHLLNDLNYYTLSECDILLDEKGKCHRFDQKCINREQFDNNYYLQYGINNNNLICYFSNKENILNNQCGDKFGFLLNEVVNYSPLLYKTPVKIKELGDYEIPELLYYNEQELKLLIPSKKCHPNLPRTIYFMKNNSANSFDLNDIVLTEENKRFFVTFFTYEEMYLHYEYIILAKLNGLIRSYRLFGNQNLIIDTLPEYILKERAQNHRINKYQKIFNYIGSTIFAKKDSLYKIYKSQQKIYNDEYNFMQESYLYPEDTNKIEEIFSNYQFNKNNLWIVKPKDSHTGNGVHIFTSLKKESDNFVISRYIHNPHLINGKKYDLRIYVLVSGLKPLRIYLNKEGLVRIATKKYNLDKKNLNDKFVHLTNTGINKLNRDYIYSNDFESKDANKLSFNVYKQYLEKEEIDYNFLREKIKDIVIKTVISGYEHLVSKLDEFNLNDRSFFNLYGYDILIDENYEPHLLEVNRRPDMHIYDKIDKVVKENLFLDTLNIVGIIPFSHDEKGEPLDDGYKIYNPVQEAVDNGFCELTRPKGNFELIFPLKKNIDKYKKFIRIKLPENENFWNKIKNEEEEDYLNT